MSKCPKCGNELQEDATECIHCGIIIKKYLEAQKKARAKKEAELAAKRKAEAEAQTKKAARAPVRNGAGAQGTLGKPAPNRPIPTRNLRLDCNACKSEQSMVATRIPRFPSLIRLIGYIIAAPSAMGVAFAGLLFVVSITQVAGENTQSMSEAAAAGAAIGTGISITIALVIAAVSLVGGLIGWLLIMKKKVFRCEVCGYILDRA
jgi:ribosomal protein L44E